MVWRLDPLQRSHLLSGLDRCKGWTFCKSWNRCRGMICCRDWTRCQSRTCCKNWTRCECPTCCKACTRFSFVEYQSTSYINLTFGDGNSVSPREREREDSFEDAQNCTGVFFTAVHLPAVDNSFMLTGDLRSLMCRAVVDVKYLQNLWKVSSWQTMQTAGIILSNRPVATHYKHKSRIV